MEIVKIDLERLRALVDSRAPVSFARFCELASWDFSKGYATDEARALAWEMLKMTPADWELIKRVRATFPEAQISAICQVST